MTLLIRMYQVVHNIDRTRKRIERELEGSGHLRYYSSAETKVEVGLRALLNAYATC